MSTAIAIRKLVKVFGTGPSAARAVDGIDLDIEPGELFFLLGPSGCGKTTLLRMIAGFIDPTEGSITFNGKDVTHTPPNKRNTGMVFQSYALWPHMTVAQNVAFGLTVGQRKVAAKERNDRVEEALAAVQMSEYASRKPNQLSGGQQQRIALARALVIRPEVLLLDEPLSNLDAKLRIELRSEIRRICKDSGLTTVYVTHDQKEALSMADRVAILKSGRVIQAGTPRECYRRPVNKFVAEFLGETNFIEARVASKSDGRLMLASPAGDLVAMIENGDAPEGDVLCSLRPEAIRIVQPGTPGSLSARHIETTYLGEIAQHTVELPDNTRVKVAELNPLGAAHDSAFLDHKGDMRSEAGSKVGLSIVPEDVVVLPRS